MLGGYNMQGNKPGVDPYLKQKIMSASPEQLISYIYDVAISSCRREDEIKSTRAINELINALNFDQKEIATRFFQLYRYILNLISKRKFDEAATMLSELRTAWAEAMKVV